MNGKLPSGAFLHARSWYSLMDGARSPEAIAAWAALAGYRSLAIADRNVLYGLPEAVGAAQARGLKAIACAALAPGGRWLLSAYCLDARGYARLCAILSRILEIEVPARRFHLPSEAAEDFPEGEGRAAGEGLASLGASPRLSTRGRPPGHKETRPPSRPSQRASLPGYDPVQDLLEGGWEGLDLVSEDRSILDRLSSGPRERRGGLYAALRAGRPLADTAVFARSRGLPLIAIQDAVYYGRGDRDLHRMLAAIERRLPYERMAGLWSEPGPEADALDAAGFARFYSAFPEALAAAEALAERAAPASSFFADPPIFPAFEGLGPDEAFRLLRSLCEAGLTRRYGQGWASRDDIGPRLSKELGIIRDKGFASYFLVVRDIVSRCPRTCGRGSAASSIVSYLLGLTHVDPLRYDLFFERFLNEGRKDPPDIDIDFPWDERRAVLDYVFDKYRGSSAMVADHCGFSRKSRIREPALALGSPEAEIARWNAAERLGRPDSIPEDLRRWAGLIAGAPRYLGCHPGGVVIVPGPIRDRVHVQPSAQGLPLIAWEKEGAERAGLVKIDLLGNRSLAVLRDCIELVSAKPAPLRGGAAPGEGVDSPLSWGSLSALDDRGSRRLIESGRTIGIFYIESPATRQLLRKMRVADYEHLVVASSIIRPAANRWIEEYVRRLRGRSWEPLAPQAEKALAETLGIMVYQEDVSRVAIACAGFDAAQADGLRKVLTKKKKGDTIRAFKERFDAGCLARGIRPEAIEVLWDMMLSFDGYSFCKAHSASYALVSYRLAWMKAYHPAEFLVSVINNRGGFYGTQTYLEEARRLGFPILPPSANRSSRGFGVEALAGPPGAGIRVGLSQIGGLSAPCVERLVQSRPPGGYPGLAAFFAAVEPDLQDLRSLVRSGALDGLSYVPGDAALTRPQALWAYRHWKREGRRGPSLESPSAEGLPGEGLPSEGGLFCSWAPPACIGDYPEAVKLADEAEVLGIIASRPPASIFAPRAARMAERLRLPEIVDSRGLRARLGRRVSMAGTAVAGKEVLAKGRDRMCFFTLQDEWGVFETVIFPAAYERVLPTLESNGAFLVVGRVVDDLGALSLSVEEAFGLNRPA